MAKIRIGFGTEFNIGSELSGIGTDNSTNTKQVLGNIHATDLKSVGVSTLATYQGFLNKEAKLSNNIDINSQAGTLGEIIIEGDVTVSSGSTICSSVDELTLTNSFSLPTGNTDSRIHCKTAGSMRFNEDFGTLEFYTGDEWRTVNSYSTNSGNAAGRAIFFGGYMRPDAPYSAGRNGLTVEYFQMSTGGESFNFGSYGSRRTNTSGCGNGTRGLSASGYNGGGTLGSSNEIEYVTIASEGDVIDFGDRTQTGYGGQAVSSSTRGVFLCNREPSNNVIDYVEIGTLGNALDFGDLNGNGGYKAGNLNSPTRGFVAGGSGPAGTNSGDIQMITIASKGNAIRVGDLSEITDNSTGASNSIRGIISAGQLGPGPFADLYAISLASEGNSFDFGDLTVARHRCAGTANQTRAIFVGGANYYSPAIYNKSIDSVTIATAGNAIDFGSLGNPKDQFGATSDCHGGLGGY